MPLQTNENDIVSRETLRIALVNIAGFRTYLAGAERRYQPPRHADIGDDPTNPDLNIAWKYLVTSKDTWLGPTLNSGGIGAIYNLTMDPFEKYDMIFNGAAPMRVQTSSPGRYSGEDNGWVLALISPVIVDFDKSIMKYPSIKRYPGGASTDLTPDLQHPEDPLPLLKELQQQPQPVEGGGG